MIHVYNDVFGARLVLIDTLSNAKLFISIRTTSLVTPSFSHYFVRLLNIIRLDGKCGVVVGRRCESYIHVHVPHERERR